MEHLARDWVTRDAGEHGSSAGPAQHAAASRQHPGAGGPPPAGPAPPGQPRLALGWSPAGAAAAHGRGGAAAAALRGRLCEYALLGSPLLL